MSSPEYDAIREAIANMQQVVATYKGHRREMCPHAIGLKGNKEHALFLQFGGGSSGGLSSDPAQNWRCIPVSGLTDIEVRVGDWHTAGNHSRPNTCIDFVDLEVAR
jgi:hypothetical protein